MFQVRNYYSLLLLLLAPTAAHAYQRAYGFCEKGGEVVVTGGVNSTTKVQRSYPQCTVNVYLTGTLTHATIYSDNSGTPKTNPFTATTTGYWYFYAANNRYDVTISGAGLSAPFTFGDIQLADPNLGPGGVTSTTAGPGIRVSPTTGAVVVSNLLGVNADYYNFTLQTPGVNLTGGVSAGITLTPCPLGVNGSDSGHYLYISGGTGGAAEAVLITGGTCTSGSTTGTVIFTPANSHNGTWTIGSAFGGSQEAISALAGTEAIVYAMTSFSAYAPLNINSSIIFQCSANTVITWSAGAQDMFVIAANNVTIRDCSLVGAATANVITNSGARVGILIDHNQISGGENGIQFTAGTDIVISNNHVSGCQDTCVGTQTSVATNYVRVIDNYVSSVNCGHHNCGAISLWGSHVIAMGNQVYIGGDADGGIVANNNPGDLQTDVVIVGNEIVAVANSPFECGSVGSVRGFVISNNNCFVSGTLTAGFLGWEVNQSGFGTVSNNVIEGNAATSLPHSGILLESVTNVNVSNNVIRRLGTNNDSHGIVMLQTNGDNPASGAMIGNMITNNTIQSTPGGIGGDIVLDTNCQVLDAVCRAAQVANNVFSGNSIFANTGAGHIGIRLSNSSGITSSLYTNNRVENNMIVSAALGIQVAGGVNFYIDNNRIFGSTVLYDDNGPTGAKIIDFNGVTFSTLSAQGGGSFMYCTDCTIANPCAGSGTGAMAKRLNSVWVCN